ncbi:MAG TPA: carbon monoxide dehydrogenase subunit G [Ktedonobacterales bacterium]|nr:carbon monoxide dehydrogenase subunit G [Ktedonobacterales bacterium]
MDISGSYTLNTPREQVWDALLDPDILKRAIPGCESLEQTDDNQYAMRLNVDVAGVKGAYQGTMRILDAQKPESYRVVVDGAGARGILHSDGVLRLTANDAGATDIHYSGQAQLGGPVASIGAQVARGAASMLLKRYFGRIASLLPAMPAVPAAAPVAAPVASVAAPVAAPAEPPPTSPPADMPPAATAAPVETFTIPTPASAVPGLYAPAPPAAPISEPPPPVVSVPSAAPAAPAAPPPAAPARSYTPAPAARSERSIENQRNSAGSIGVIIAILAVVIVVIVVLVVVGAFR